MIFPCGTHLQIGSLSVFNAEPTFRYHEIRNFEA